MCSSWMLGRGWKHHRGTYKFLCRMDNFSGIYFNYIDINYIYINKKNWLFIWHSERWWLVKGVFLIGKKLEALLWSAASFYRVDRCNFTNNNESATILNLHARGALCRSTQMSWQENWCHMATTTWVNIGSDNGLLPNVTKPLSEPTSTFRQRFCVAFSREQFHPTCSCI